MGSRLVIRPPRDYLLARDVCSYGYFLLAPTLWEPETRTLSRVLTLEDGPATVRIAQEGDGRSKLKGPGRAGGELRVMADRALSSRERAEAKRQIARMLHMDGAGSEEGVAAFHRVDGRWKKSGRARLFRSPTLWEDVVKTVTSCNVAWPSTVGMNRRLCDVLGRGAFPSAEKVARTRVTTLRARCRVGYRDQRMVELAKMFRSGEIDEGWLTDPAVSDDEVFAFLKRLPGIGPYSAGNIMQLVGRYSRLAVDTETVRHARAALGMEGTDAALMRRVETHYEAFGDHRFRSYWFELWAWYESRRGASWDWAAREVGKSFTASQFAREDA